MKQFIFLFIISICFLSTAYSQKYTCAVFPDENNEIELSIIDYCGQNVQWQMSTMSDSSWNDIQDATSNPYILNVDSIEVSGQMFRAIVNYNMDGILDTSYSFQIKILKNFDEIGIHDSYNGTFIYHKITSDSLLGYQLMMESTNWGCKGMSIPKARSTSIGSGYYNTKQIIANCNDTLNAASICWNSTLNQLSNWYLPSKQELQKIKESYLEIGLNYFEFVWSSSQLPNSVRAWTEYLKMGSNSYAHEVNRYAQVIGSHNITNGEEYSSCRILMGKSIKDNYIEVSNIDSSLTSVAVKFKGEVYNGANYKWDFDAWNFKSTDTIIGSGLGPFEVHYNYGGFDRINLTKSKDGCIMPFISDTFNVELFENFHPNFPAIIYGDVEWGYVNDDLWPDVLLTGNDTSQLYLNNKATEFVPIDYNLPSLIKSSCQWVDLNNDGYQDILLSGLDRTDSTTQMHAYLNNGESSFNQIDLNIPGIRNGFIKTLDFNNDGLQDIFVSGSTNEDSVITRLYRNLGQNEFYENNAPFNGLTYSEADVGDFNNNGFQDIVIIGSQDSMRFSALYINQKGEFIKSNQKFIPLNNGGVDWADYNNDGYLDIAVSGMREDYIWEREEPTSWNFDSRVSASLYIYLNIAGDTLIEHISYEGWKGHLLSEIGAVDYDNDGDCDLFCLGHPGTQAAVAVTGGPDFIPPPPLYSMPRLYRNENKLAGFKNIQPNIPNTSRWFDFGEFGESRSVGGNPALRNSALAFSDYNLDGNIDILRDGKSPNATIYRNQPFQSNTPPLPPSSLIARTNCDSIILSWDAASDDHTPAITLTYDIYISSTPGGSDIVSQANIYELRTKQFKLNRSLPSGTYYWSVRAQDNTKIWGNWAPEQSFTIDVPETPEIRAEGDTLYSNINEGNQWYNEDGPIPGATEPSYVIPQSGTYYNIVTQNGCSSDTSNVLDVFLSSDRTAAWADQIRVFPNPFDDKISIQSYGIPGPISYEVSNPLGQIILNGVFKGNISLNTAAWTRGNYNLTLIYRNSKTTQQVLKQ